MSADRDITPRLIEYLQTELPVAVPDPHRRPSFPACQLVLRQLARWARATDVPGQWTTTESVGQMAVGTGLGVGPIRRALDALERLGLVVTVKRGGGQGTSARGSTRTLVLDATARAVARAVDGVNCARWTPELRALEPGTARAQARDTASSSASSSARDADADAVDPAAGAGVIPSHVLDKYPGLRDLVRREDLP